MRRQIYTGGYIQNGTNEMRKVKDSLAFAVAGIPWVVYPSRMRFPKEFATIYPFRGRGVVSRMLFILNRLGLDRFLLREAEQPLADLLVDGKIAWFWPAPSRSKGRFYGYCIREEKISEYIKVAAVEAEKAALKREVKNLKFMTGKNPATFKFPRLIDLEEKEDFLFARFEPLPSDSKPLPNNSEWLKKVERARKEIASFGIAHGDFLSHNMKVSGEDLWIIDWEELMLTPPVLLDEISFKTAFLFFHCHKSLAWVCKWFTYTYLSDKTRREDAIASLKSMRDRNVGLGGAILNCKSLRQFLPIND